MNKEIKPLTLTKSLLIFGIPSLFFLFIVFIAIPYFNNKLGTQSALIPLCGSLLLYLLLIIVSISLTYRDGFCTKQEFLARLRIKKLSSRDWRYVIFASLSIFAVNGLIIGVSKLLNLLYGIPIISSNPQFFNIESIFGSQKYLILVFCILFMVNILGDEFLWRGYILPRQEIFFKKKAWILNSIFWGVFNLCFGIQLFLMLLPILVFLPYSVYKTQNTNVGILIHTFMNGPMFLIVSLGII